MNSKIGIIIIVERGILEKYSLLAVKSIREFGGQLSTVPIICYSPRKDYYPSNKTQLELKKHQVEIIKNDLNREFRYYSLANKPLVINEINKKYNFDYLLFFDSDTIILDQPINLFTHKNFVAASPSWYNIVGANNAKHPNFNYWEKLADLLGFDLSSSPFVELHFEKGTFLGNWNTGVLSFNNIINSDMIENWKWCLEKILHNKLFPPKASIYLVEETAFAASVMLNENEVSNLNIYYNYPIERIFDEKLKRINANLSEVKVIHHLKHHNHLLSYKEWDESKEMKNKRNWLLENMDQPGFNNQDKYTINEKIFFLRKIFKERSTYLLQKYLKL